MVPTLGEVETGTMLIDVLTGLLRRTWGFLQSGWAWVVRRLRAVADDVVAFLARLEDVSSGATRRAAAPASPGVSAAATEAPARTPQAAPPRQAEPVAPSAVPAPAAKDEAGKKAATASLLSAAAALLATEATTARSAPVTATEPPTARSAPVTATEPPTPNDRSDETALARMVASDDSPREVTFVRAWIAVQHQRARRVSMFEFLTRGQGYGPRNRKAPAKLTLYASTSEAPSDTDRVVARTLLAGLVAPSVAIRAHKPGQLIERGKDLTDAQILRRQADIKEGIYGRIEGTAWLLLSPDAPAIAPKKGQSAAEALDAVASVPVMDAAERTAAGAA